MENNKFDNIPAFPEIYGGIINHELFGELFDRLQVQKYALKYAEIYSSEVQPTPPEMRAGMELQLKEIERLRNQLAEKSKAPHWAQYAKVCKELESLKSRLKEVEAQRNGLLNTLGEIANRSRDKTITAEDALTLALVAINAVESEEQEGDAE